MSNTITLYKYMKCEYAETTIRQQELYMDDGTNYNDPFELLEIDSLTGVASRITGLHMVCFTGGFRRKLMWSHYADSHKGICLTVKLPKEIVFPVFYTSKRVFSNSNVDDYISGANREVPRNFKYDLSMLSRNGKIALIKDKKWEDEKEYRIVGEMLNEKYFLIQNNKWFLKSKIENVYLGAEFDKNKEDIKLSIIDACKSIGISVKKMELSKKDYSLVPTILN